MKTAASRIRLLALVLIVLLPSLGRAQALADRLPPDAIIYVGWTGAGVGHGFAGSHFEAVLNESNIPAVANSFIPRLFEKIETLAPDAREQIELVRSLLGPMYRHPTALAFMGVEMGNANGPTPHAILLCDAGDDAAALKTQLDQLMQNAGHPPFPVNVVNDHGLVAIVIGYDKPEDAIVAAGAGNKSLATSAPFAAALAQVNKDPITTLYIDVDKLGALVDSAAAMAGPDAQGTWGKAREALGLKGVHHAMLTQGFEGKDWTSRGFVDAPAPRSGFIGSMIESKPLSREILTQIPVGATIANAGHFDVGGLVSSIREAIPGFNPDVAKQVDQAFDAINQAAGFDVQKDLLEALGDEWAGYVDPSIAGNSTFTFAVVNHLKDPAKVEASLDKLADVITKFAAQQTKDGPVRLTFYHVKFGAVTVHYLGMPLVTPAWAIANGNLYLAMYPEVAAAAALHMPARDKSLLDNPAYINLQERLGKQAPSAIGFVDLPRVAPLNYSTWFMISHAANGGDLIGVPAPLMILPPLGRLMPHLQAAGEIAWTDAAGLHFRAVSPFPGSEILAADMSSLNMETIPVMVSIMLPALQRARDSASRIKSASNLRMIGQASFMYSNVQKDGSFPKDLGDVLDQDLTLDVFVNPRTNTAVPHGLTPEQAKEWVKTNSDYEYAGAGKKNNAPAADQLPIAWEKPDRVQEGINILFADGHVEWQMMDMALATIEKAKPAPK